MVAAVVVDVPDEVVVLRRAGIDVTGTVVPALLVLRMGEPFRSQHAVGVGPVEDHRSVGMDLESGVAAPAVGQRVFDERDVRGVLAERGAPLQEHVLRRRHPVREHLLRVGVGVDRALPRATGLGRSDAAL